VPPTYLKDIIEENKAENHAKCETVAQ